MVKQIRNGDLVNRIIDRGDSYFRWLQEKSGLSGPLSSMLADTEFVSLYNLDDVLIEKAREELRNTYAEEVCKKEEKYDAKDVETVYKSVRGNCCLFEIMLCLAIAVNEMVDLSDEDMTPKFFAKMLENSCMDKYDEEDFDMREKEVTAYWQKCIDRIIKRDYSDIGAMGLFPLSAENLEETHSDRRNVSLWKQMNDWVDQHTNEDGEWVD